MKEYGIQPIISDPAADREEAMRLYKVEFTEVEKIREMDAVILAVSHKEFAKISMRQLDAMFKKGKNRKKVIVDVKGVLDKDEYVSAGYNYWRL